MEARAERGNRYRSGEHASLNNLTARTRQRNLFIFLIRVNRETRNFLAHENPRVH